MGVQRTVDGLEAAKVLVEFKGTFSVCSIHTYALELYQMKETTPIHIACVYYLKDSESGSAVFIIPTRKTARAGHRYGSSVYHTYLKDRESRSAGQ